MADEFDNGKRHPDPTKNIHMSEDSTYRIEDGFHIMGTKREVTPAHFEIDYSKPINENGDYEKKWVPKKVISTPIKEKILHSTFNFNTSKLNNFGNSDLKFSEDSNDIKALMKAYGIYDRLSEDVFFKFSRIPVIDPYNALLATKEYIFITKPDLALFNTSTGEVTGGLANVPFFVDASKRYNYTMTQLQSSIFTNSNPFMTLLSNTVTSPLDIPGISAEMIETPANIMGTKISYRGTSHKSDEEHDFNLEFEDNKYLDVYMLFKIWDEYEKYKWAGKVDFSAESCGTDRWKNYILNKVLHDQVSIYKFIVADDGQRLIYWAKLTGCTPTTIPRDSFGDMTDMNPTKITVGWKCHFVRDMDPVILQQFNTLMSSYSAFNAGADMPIYDLDNSRINGAWSVGPYIQTISTTNSRRGSTREYYLKWRHA